MPDHNNLRSAQLAPSARLTPQPGLLPAAEVFPAAQMRSLPSAYLPVSVQQPVGLPENRPKPIPIHQYPFDTLPLYILNDPRSPAEQWRMLPRPIEIPRGMMNYPLTSQKAFMLNSWIKGPSMLASNNNTTHYPTWKEKYLMNGSMTALIVWRFNKSLERLGAILAKMQKKNCFQCLVLRRGQPCHQPYPQRPMKAANGQGGVQNGHGEGLNHVQRGESSTARAGPQQPTPQATPAIKTVRGINESPAQLTTRWKQTEDSLLAQISYVASHGIIANENQQTRDLEQVISCIDDFVLGAQHRVHEIRALVSGFWAAVNNPNGNSPAPATAPDPRANSLKYIKNLTMVLLERLIMGLLKVLVPLFAIHKDMGTTEALLMLRIEGCKRGWIPFLTEVLRLAFGGNDGAECEYLRTQARNRGLWKFWSLVVTGNRWAIDAIADPRTIANGLSTSSIKVYLMPKGWDGKGWKGLMSQVTNQKPASFPNYGVYRMVWEMDMQMKLLSRASGGSGSRSSQQPGGYNNNNHSNNHNMPPPPRPNLYQINPMPNAGNHGQQPQQSGNGYGIGHTPPQVPPPNGHKRPRADSYDGPYGCGCGCGAKYGCGRASGSGSQKRRREDEYACPQTPQGSPLNPNGYKRPHAPPDSYDGPYGCGCGCGAKYGCGRASGSGSQKRRREDEYAFPQTPQGPPPRSGYRFTPALTNGYGGQSKNESGRRKRQRSESERRRILEIRRLEAEKKKHWNQGPPPNPSGCKRAHAPPDRYDGPSENESGRRKRHRRE